jgi:hypothetical protein
MGFDPPGLGEVYEVCIELAGPVDATAFQQFEKDLQACIKKLGAKKTKAQIKVK